jgi:hypothetical protein
MSVSYKKLLPKIMQTTRWGELIDVVQSIWVDIRTFKINVIYSRFTRSAAIYELKELANFLGYKLLFLNGATSDKNFILRQIEAIPYKIKNKTGSTAYKWTGYPYNFVSTAYVVVQSNKSPIWTNKLRTLFNQAQPTTLIQINTLDAESDNILYYQEVIGNTFDSTSGNFGFDLSNLITFDLLSAIYADPKTTGATLALLD